MNTAPGNYTKLAAHKITTNMLLLQHNLYLWCQTWSLFYCSPWRQFFWRDKYNKYTKVNGGMINTNFTTLVFLKLKFYLISPEFLHLNLNFMLKKTNKNTRKRESETVREGGRCLLCRLTNQPESLLV